MAKKKKKSAKVQDIHIRGDTWKKLEHCEKIYSASMRKKHPQLFGEGFQTGIEGTLNVMMDAFIYLLEHEDEMND